MQRRETGQPRQIGHMGIKAQGQRPAQASRHPHQETVNRQGTPTTHTPVAFDCQVFFGKASVSPGFTGKVEAAS
jgi:hypothetical protein